jgi:hypothetical protein
MENPSKIWELEFNPQESGKQKADENYRKFNPPKRLPLIIQKRKLIEDLRKSKVKTSFQKTRNYNTSNSGFYSQKNIIFESTAEARNIKIPQIQRQLKTMKRRQNNLVSYSKTENITDTTGQCLNKHLNSEDKSALQISTSHHSPKKPSNLNEIINKSSNFMNSELDHNENLKNLDISEISSNPVHNSQDKENNFSNNEHILKDKQMHKIRRKNEGKKERKSVLTETKDFERMKVGVDKDLREGLLERKKGKSSELKERENSEEQSLLRKLPPFVHAVRKKEKEIRDIPITLTHSSCTQSHKHSHTNSNTRTLANLKTFTYSSTHYPNTNVQSNLPVSPITNNLHLKTQNKLHPSNNNPPPNYSHNHSQSDGCYSNFHNQSSTLNSNIYSFPQPSQPEFSYYDLPNFISAKTNKDGKPVVYSSCKLNPLPFKNVLSSGLHHFSFTQHVNQKQNLLNSTAATLNVNNPNNIKIGNKINTYCTGAVSPHSILHNNSSSKNISNPAGGVDCCPNSLSTEYMYGKINMNANLNGNLDMNMDAGGRSKSHIMRRGKKNYTSGIISGEKTKRRDRSTGNNSHEKEGYFEYYSCKAPTQKGSFIKRKHNKAPVHKFSPSSSLVNINKKMFQSFQDVLGHHFNSNYSNFAAESLLLENNFKYECQGDFCFISLLNVTQIQNIID